MEKICSGIGAKIVESHDLENVPCLRLHLMVVSTQAREDLLDDVSF